MGGNKRKELNPLDTNVHGSATKGKGPTVVEMGDVGDHIEKLRQVSSTTEKLMKLVGDQLHVLSETVPVAHGFEVVRIQFHPSTLA